jgi:hypothetical protein
MYAVVCCILSLGLETSWAQGAEIVIHNDQDVTTDQVSATLMANPARPGMATFQFDTTAISLSAAGEPEIPWRVLSLLLPPTTDLAAVECRVDAASYEPEPGAWSVSPMAPPTAMDPSGQILQDWPKGKKILAGKDTDIYQTDAFWPAQAARVNSRGSLRGWKMVEIAIPLVRYNPVQNTLERLTTLEASLVSPRTRSAAVWSRQIGTERVARLAANYSKAAGAYASTPMGVRDETGTLAPSLTPSGKTGYLILIPAALQSASTKLAAFVAHKQALGFTVSVYNESTWGGGATGQARANNLRAWLRANYLAKDAKFVLLIGNPSENGNLPMKYCLGSDEYHPTDYYYAELTGNWDANGNGVYGEELDNPEKLFEVYVGRIPNYGDVTQLDSILQKTMDYESSTDRLWRRNVLLPMVPLDDSTPAYQMGEQIKNNFLEPKGIPSDRIYDANYGCLPPPEYLRSDAYPANVWRDHDYGLNIWNTHGWAQGASGIISSGETTPLDNAHPAACYQGSCENGHPEYSDNLGYSILLNGGISTIAASRNGWYYIGQGDFTWTSSVGGLGYAWARRMLINNDTNGMALWNAKEELPFWLKNYYVYNFYGDPSLSILDSIPLTIAPTHHYVLAPRAGTPVSVNRTYTLTNTSGHSIKWNVTKTADWLADPTPSSGIVLNNGKISVTVKPKAGWQDLAPGEYSDLLTFTNETDGGDPVTRRYTLDVTEGSLKAWWKLDEATGSLAADASQSSSTGKLKGGPTWNPAHFDNGLTFDGADDHVVAPALNLNSNVVTLTGWVKRTGGQADWAGLVFCRGNNTCTGLNMLSGGELRYHWNDGQYGFSSGLVVPSGVWTFVALVVEPAKATFYMSNGAGMRSAVNYAAHDPEQFDAPIMLGRDSFDGRFFKGMLDDVRVYNYALSSSDLTAIRMGGGRAETPSPADGATNVPYFCVPLNWVGSLNALSHNVYFGTSSTAVSAATPTSPEFLGNVTATTFTIPTPLPNTQYFWRVDEVEADAVKKGIVWSFTTMPENVILTEYWNDITGETVANLTTNANYPNHPTTRGYLNSKFQLRSDIGDHYGTRVRALLKVPTTGLYTFWISSDDSSSLYLSQTPSASDKKRVAYVSGWTDPLVWTANVSQRSASVSLTAGQSYYIETLHKEGEGGDHLAVAWQGPGFARQVIPASALYAYNPNAVPAFSGNPLQRPAAQVSRPYLDTLAGSATDSDMGQTLQISKLGGPAWLTVAPDGALSGTPGGEDVGLNSWIISVSDGQGGTAQTVLRILVTPGPVPRLEIY